METQQQRWADERRRRGLEPGCDNFLRAGRATLLDDALAIGAVIPADPLATPLDFDVTTQDLMRSRFTGHTSGGVSLLSEVVVTNDAVLRAAHLAEAGTRAYLAVTRSGGAEVGFGAASVRYVDNGAVRFRLAVLAHAARVLVETQSSIIQSLSIAGPFEVLVAVAGTENGCLSGVAAGWEEPMRLYPVPICRDSNLLVRLQVDQWPKEAPGQLELVEQLADRICNAFGILQRVYAPYSNEGPGHMDESYA